MTFLWLQKLAKCRAASLGTPALVTLLVFSHGCGTESAQTNSIGSGPESAEIAEGVPVSEESAKRFAEELVAAVSSADSPRPINDFLDVEAIVDTTTSNLEFSTELRRQFQDAVSKSLHSPSGFLPLVRRAVTDGGSYRLLQNYEEGGRRVTVHTPWRSDSGWPVVTASVT